LFLLYRLFHHYHHGLRTWCDYLRCHHSFLKIEVDLCFKFYLREAFDIRDFLKETTGAFKLKFDCSVVQVSCVNLYRKYNLMVCQKWIDFNFTLINFSVNVWDTLIWAHWWPYELIGHFIWAHPCALSAYRRSEYVC
jgi:hypothetical protein